MSAGAAAEFVRISSKLKRWPLLKPQLNVLSSVSKDFTSARRFYRPPGLYKTKRISPLVRVPRPTPPVVPDSLFRDATARHVNTNWNDRRSNALRFILANTALKPDPAITILPRPTGMLCYLQVVSTPTADTPGACLMLHFDNRRYIFGRMAEGTQRNMVQRKVSLAKIHDIFLTGTIDWESTGGLLGMILTLADLKAASAADLEMLNEKNRNQGKKDVKSQQLAHLNLHGGKNLIHLLATARRFILRKALPVHPREIRRDPRAGADKQGEPDYEDENIRVWSIPLSAESSAACSPGQHSPKKRKLSPPADSEAAPEDIAAEEADQTIREGVVKDMFCSKWKLDTLREFRLADVQLPAKIFVRNDQGHIEPYNGPPASEAPDTRVLVRLPWPASHIEQLPPTKPSKQSMCYIVKCHGRRGKFDAKAALDLGVDKRDNKKLTQGESVTGKDGVVVTPEMVMGAPVEGHGFAVVDLPSADLIDELLERQEWSNAEIMSCIDTMYWILSDGITVEDPRIQHFIKERSSIKHIVLGSAACPNVPALESPISQLIKMNRIDKDRFPLPDFETKQPASLGKAAESLTEAGQAGWRFQLAPKPTVLTDAVVPVMDTGRPIWELSTHAPQALQLADAARKAVSDPVFLAEIEKSQADLPSPQTEIIPLGTGSAMPSKYRNVSATLIRVPGWGSYLLDCGENTLGQLRRSFGHYGADEVLKDLRAIYISHAHADHHLGTISVIARWRDVAHPARKLAIIATPKYQDFVREFHQVQNLSPSRLVPVVLRPVNSRPLPGITAKPTFYPATDSTAITLPRIESCFVDHCFEATALALTFPDTGLKIAYSGDCRPSQPFARLARGAHLLIHECTFDDELGGDALAKKHSTLSEALDVGAQMRARRILLTHFSQRYPKLPVVNEERLRAEGAERDVEVLFAFDLMRVRLGEFKQAKMFLPALRELLREGERAEEGEE